MRRAEIAAYITAGLSAVAYAAIGINSGGWVEYSDMIVGSAIVAALGYALGRRLTSQRLFEKRYGSSYDWYIKSEHFNVPAEITAELDKRFERRHAHWYPLRVPSVHLNLCVGFTYVRR